jgi:hypothetical protein
MYEETGESSPADIETAALFSRFLGYSPDLGDPGHAVPVKTVHGGAQNGPGSKQPADGREDA